MCVCDKSTLLALPFAYGATATPRGKPRALGAVASSPARHHHAHWGRLHHAPRTVYLQMGFFGWARAVVSQITNVPGLHSDEIYTNPVRS
jgi:hypothetical protein